MFEPNAAVKNMYTVAKHNQKPRSIYSYKQQNHFLTKQNPDISTNESMFAR